MEINRGAGDMLTGQGDIMNGTSSCLSLGQQQRQCLFLLPGISNYSSGVMPIRDVQHSLCLGVLSLIRAQFCEHYWFTTWLLSFSSSWSGQTDKMFPMDLLYKLLASVICTGTGPPGKQRYASKSAQFKDLKIIFKVPRGKPNLFLGKINSLLLASQGHFFQALTSLDLSSTLSIVPGVTWALAFLSLSKSEIWATINSNRIWKHGQVLCSPPFSHKVALDIILNNTPFPSKPHSPALDASALLLSVVWCFCLSAGHRPLSRNCF